jgi:hypothetical protein
LCVFCGSNRGRHPLYAEAARLVGGELARRGLGLVYGGGNVGLMGALADAAIAGGGHVIGVIPEALLKKELAHRGVGDLRVVGSMHERKALMAELADGFITLPGGFGTLEELFEVITWAQLGFHRKPCGLLNVAGFFDPLLRFVEHTTAENFIRPEHRALLLVETAIGPLLDRMAAYQPPAAHKWIDQDRL